MDFLLTRINPINSLSKIFLRIEIEKLVYLNWILFQPKEPYDKNGNVYGLGNLSAKVAGGKNKRGIDSAVTDTLTHLQHEFASYKDETQQQMTTLAQQNQQLLQFLQSQFPSFPPHLASMMMPPPSTRPDGSGSSANQDDQSPDF